MLRIFWLYALLISYYDIDTLLHFKRYRNYKMVQDRRIRAKFVPQCAKAPSSTRQIASADVTAQPRAGYSMRPGNKALRSSIINRVTRRQLVESEQKRTEPAYRLVLTIHWTSSENAPVLNSFKVIIYFVKDTKKLPQCIWLVRLLSVYFFVFIYRSPFLRKICWTVKLHN